MFNFIKDISKLMEFNKILSNEKVVVEKDGIKIQINGKMEIEEVVLNSSLSIEKQQKLLKECFNEAIRKIQMVLVNKIGDKMR